LDDWVTAIGRPQLYQMMVDRHNQQIEVYETPAYSMMLGWRDVEGIEAFSAWAGVQKPGILEVKPPKGDFFGIDFELLYDRVCKRKDRMPPPKDEFAKKIRVELAQMDLMRERVHELGWPYQDVVSTDNLPIYVADAFAAVTTLYAQLNIGRGHGGASLLNPVQYYL
jgi:hypothetical protein